MLRDPVRRTVSSFAYHFSYSYCVNPPLISAGSDPTHRRHHRATPNHLLSPPPAVAATRLMTGACEGTRRVPIHGDCLSTEGECSFDMLVRRSIDRRSALEKCYISATRVQWYTDVFSLSAKALFEASHTCRRFYVHMYTGTQVV